MCLVYRPERTEKCKKPCYPCGTLPSPQLVFPWWGKQPPSKGYRISETIRGRAGFFSLKEDDPIAQRLHAHVDGKYEESTA